MGTALIRADLRKLHKAADDAHAGLLLQRGLPDHKAEGWQDGGGSGGDAKAKTAHIQRVCDLPAGEFYANAFARWSRLTEDAQRFRQVRLALKSRLFIGMAGGGALETGCAISHSHGMPYIPGSSLKGVVSHHAREQLGKEGRAAMRELFGSEPTTDRPAGLAGLVYFHDAWWVPEPPASPFVQEVVTTHHMQYYGEGGKQPATDFDSPVPNTQIAVQGAFLFVLEGPCAWLGLAEDMLVDALHTRGIGAKTRAGYGFFKREAILEPRATCPWVDQNVERLSKEHHASTLDTLRGKPLADAWAAIPDPALKREARADILARLEQDYDLAPSNRAQQIYEQPESEEAP